MFVTLNAVKDSCSHRPAIPWILRCTQDDDGEASDLFGDDRPCGWKLATYGLRKPDQITRYFFGFAKKTSQTPMAAMRISHHK